MTTPEQRWDALIEGASCPFCQPRADDTPFWGKVASLGVSTLYLDRSQTYPGHCQLVFDPRHVVGLEALSPEEFSDFAQDFAIAARAITAACRPDLMNYSSLGNVIPHLHWHLVPRYKGDPRWGGPIYTTTREEMRKTIVSDAAFQDTIAAIRDALACEP